MSRKLSFTITTLLAGLLVLVLILGWGIFRKQQLDESSLQLAIDTTQTIFSESNAQQLIVAAHPELLAQKSSESLQSWIISVARILGPIDTLDAIRGAADVPLLPVGGSLVTANYVIDLVFSGNPAQAVMEMRWEDEKWKFIAYRLDSPLLLN